MIQIEAHYGEVETSVSWWRRWYSLIPTLIICQNNVREWEIKALPRPSNKEGRGLCFLKVSPSEAVGFRRRELLEGWLQLGEIIEDNGALADARQHLEAGRFEMGVTRIRMNDGTTTIYQSDNQERR